MSTFAAGSIGALDYDFTAIRKADGTFCTGKGTIPEPAASDLDAFYVALKGLMEGADGQDGVDSFVGVLGALAKVCAGSPTEAELRELPARYLTGFARWLSEEFTDPKA